MNKQFYKCTVFDDINQTRECCWENTNYLLQVPGFRGVKTGITNTAGPCLVSWYCDKGSDFLVVLLCSKSMEARWFETVKLVNWAMKKFNQFNYHPIPIEEYLGSEEEFYY